MARRDDVADLEEFGRFGEPALLILVSLADGPKHGYSITEDIASFAGVRFGPSPPTITGTPALDGSSGDACTGFGSAGLRFSV